jgi:tetrahydromethanopterin S-methyltransferase subunit B
MSDVNEERFEIWGECESMGIEKEIIDHAPDRESARYLVGEYTMAFYGWYIWYVDTEQELEHA